MVEVCSRAPAIGECVWLGVALPWSPWWCMVSGPRLGYSFSHLLLDVITDLFARFLRLWDAQTEAKLMWLDSFNVVHTAESYLIRNYLKKARLHFRSIQTSRGLNRLHLGCVLWNRMPCAFLSLYLLLFKAPREGVCYSLFYFTGCVQCVLFSLIGNLWSLRVHSSIDLFHGRHFDRKSKAATNDINDGKIPLRCDRKSLKWASMHSVDGLQPLLILVKPLIDNTKCPLWEMFLFTHSHFERGCFGWRWLMAITKLFVRII